MRHGHRHEDLVAELDARKLIAELNAAMRENRVMRHQRRPETCWCGDRHTASEAFGLNISTDLAQAPEPSDEATEIAREYEAQEET